MIVCIPQATKNWLSAQRKEIKTLLTFLFYLLFKYPLKQLNVWIYSIRLGLRFRNKYKKVTLIIALHVGEMSS